ncbi:hypothetical protein [Erwinia sp. JUb26]|uniref:hypothetical protein n=1 Tax=Erwinia sp. JUb26 TaxID=2485126 RepID=UPI000F46C7B9|nr:hypothetical protein [Erwinia sp. JUb26]ROR15470.1 hypothetical protein EC836_101977 [Erwinia sp. JUb26]
MAKITAAILLTVIPLFTTGCISLSPSEKPSATSPQLQASGKAKLWNDATLFGKVPATLQHEGDVKCAAQHKGAAIGYHPHAKKADGSYFQGNAYLCSMI